MSPSHTMLSRLPAVTALLALAAVTFLSGCGPKADPQREADIKAREARARALFGETKRAVTELRLGTLRMWYAVAEDRLGRPPASREELFKAVPNAKDNETWQSDADGQPFEVRWGARLFKGPRQALFWESKPGPDQKRAVLTTTDDKVQWLTDADLEALRK